VEFFEEHWSRLEAACRQCGWAFDFSRKGSERAGDWLREACGSAPAFARIYLTAGEGGVGDPVSEPRLFLYAERRGGSSSRTSSSSSHPYRLAVCPAPHLPLLGGLKTANYWANLEALAAARGTGGDEALRFNPRGELISACMANVFAVVDGRLTTPPASTGARQGVIRQWVMQRRPVTERILLRSDLERIEECFLTSSWQGIVPAAMLHSRPLRTTLAESLRGEWADFFDHLG
jgi:branched-chain amino acid aminotransferase